MKMIIAAVVVSVVILTECVLAFLIIPSTAAVQAKLNGEGHEAEAPAAAHDDGHGKPAAHGAAKAGGHGSGHDKPADKGHGKGHDSGHGGGHGAAGPTHDPNGKTEVEADLGKFNIIVHQPASGVTLKINFHLFGTVIESDMHEADELAKKNQHRLRDQVIFEIRNSDIGDLTDPGLALIKRKILAKSNELLGRPLLKGVVFSDFSFVEQ